MLFKFTLCGNDPNTVAAGWVTPTTQVVLRSESLV